MAHWPFFKLAANMKTIPHANAQLYNIGLEMQMVKARAKVTSMEMTSLGV